MNMDRLAEAIRSAGQSATGFARLLLIFVSGALIVLLQRAPSSLRFLVYCLLAIGLGTFFWLVYLAMQAQPVGGRLG
jgi:hypothetical protein